MPDIVRYFNGLADPWTGNATRHLLRHLFPEIMFIAIPCMRCGENRR
jgi:hypothetical protein